MTAMPCQSNEISDLFKISIGSAVDNIKPDIPVDWFHVE
jgi:hypothetical protein